MEDFEILYEEPGAFIKLRFDEFLQAYMMHLDCTAWSKSEFKRYLKIFRIVCSDLKARGINEVYGLCKDKKAVKFNKMFGATVVNNLLEMEDGTYQILMKMEMK